MKIYNTLSKKIEDFEPLEKQRVVIYVCGLTPYDHTHIGYGRTCVSFDVIKRYLKHKGYSVYHIQNITDVDDKILKRSKETAEEPLRLTKRYHDEAEEALDKLRVIQPDIYPKVTEHIADIIALISKLVEKGYAYETEAGVYFSVEKFKDYGKLSGQSTEQLQTGARVEIDETKRSPLDFALWKKTKGELLEFDSPFGRGRPGWHIECSAMNWKCAQRTLDIHGGGRDLIFPHHENEIAQSEAALDKPLAKYWIHAGSLTVNGEKMSKSLGNFIRLIDVVNKFDSNAIRLFFLQTHYRSPMDYNEEQIKATAESIERIFNTLGLLREEKAAKQDKKNKEFEKKTKELVSAFYEHMENDFDTPGALAALFNLLRATNQHLKENAVDKTVLDNAEKELEKMLDILGLKEQTRSIDSKLPELNTLLKELGEKEESSAKAAMQKIIELREAFRKKKEYKKSDEIRKKLHVMGIILEDKEKGVRWKLK